MESTDRAPANGLKLLAIVVLFFAGAALYGQWQRERRTDDVQATILPAPAVSPTPPPNEKRRRFE